jgi:hypothetical protein
MASSDIESRPLTTIRTVTIPSSRYSTFQPFWSGSIQTIDPGLPGLAGGQASQRLGIGGEHTSMLVRRPKTSNAGRGAVRMTASRSTA